MITSLHWWKKNQLEYKKKMNLKDLKDKFHLKKDEKIIIACSWWCDSMFLLSEAVISLGKEKIIVVHFNHHLRWEESNRDEKFVEKYCKDNNIIYVCWRDDINKLAQKLKVWIEEAARIARYNFLRDIKTKEKASYIMTAHHLDDSIETFIFNLVRWAKLSWLTWIEEENCDIIRPLITTTKEDILKACKDRKIPFIEDSTNIDDKYLRNHIRLNIIPEFSKINPNFRNNLSYTMWYFKELREHLDNEIQSKIREDSYFEVKEFFSLSSFIQKELIAYIFRLTNKWSIWLTSRNIDEVIRFIGDTWNWTKKDIKEMKLTKRKGKVYFTLDIPFDKR